MQRLKLLDVEWTTAICPPISTVTFYSTTDAPHSSTKAYIQQRVDAIVQANPWLAGRLTSGLFLSNITLEFNHTPSAVIVEEAHLPNLSNQLDYSQIAAMCMPFNVVSGATMINSNHPMVRVTWITISDTQGALFFSVAHGIADGYTYYRLYGMLSAKTPIGALTCTRFMDFSSKVEETVKGRNDASPLFSSLPYMVNLAGTMMLTPSPSYTLHTVNQEWIAEEKAKHKSASPVGYVSTNDIITSWAFRTTKCDVGFIAINYRGRIDGVERHLAGNYESAIGYQPDDYATPALIRESLATNGFRRARSGAFPSMWTKTSTFVSSWISLYEPAELPRWTMIEHLPSASGNVPFTATIVVFQRTPSSVGVLAVSRVELTGDSDAAAALTP
ncbi:hypothetical protein LEN26_011838 [Aphanomyces euteiches]|nr:hypothetical protein LEN26_011838 [Aphanomyces euteiches]KAH9128367.1 hypothetical protein AeMF1_001467 [Aphanomyces euteiches]KAH9183514.1 hypothetical protein AeNC1_014514 [Aphanomyces euteiches]